MMMMVKTTILVRSQRKGLLRIANYSRLNPTQRTSFGATFSCASKQQQQHRHHQQQQAPTNQGSTTTSSNISNVINVRNNITRRNNNILFLVSALSLTAGFVAGRRSVPSHPEDNNNNINNSHNVVLPNGLPRTCCDSSSNNSNNDNKKQPELTQAQKDLFKTLKRIVGRVNVLDGTVQTTETSPYLKGARLGQGTALYIVKPKKLQQLIEIVYESVEAGCVVLAQGQNTGLTGGSVPRNNDNNGNNNNDNSIDDPSTNRPVVLVSMKDLDTIFPIDNGKRVVCLAGAGLASLQHFLQTEFPDRESHSILGSTFLNPTVAAGVALNSGGTQCRKGPAHTDRALFLKVVQDKFGRNVVKVVNTMGIQSFDNEQGEFDSHLRHDGVIPKLDRYCKFIQEGHRVEMKQSNDTFGKHASSDINYKTKLCTLDDNISRFNADTSGCDCNRSEGKVLILASVHDTYPKPSQSKTFWISCDSLETCLEFRRQVCLHSPQDVPVSMEYMDRDSFDVIDESGRILGNVIQAVGTSSSMVRTMWNIKLWIEALNITGSSLLVDKILYHLNYIFPPILPKSIMTLGRTYNHHIAMTIGDFDGSLNRALQRMKSFETKYNGKIIYHECTSKNEETSLSAFRFVAAPAFRTWCVGKGYQGFSVDYALPKNGGQAPNLSSSSSLNNTTKRTITTTKPIKRMRYSHFGCNVVHEDLAYPVGVDIHSVKMQLKKTVEQECGGKLPAEHGHGTEYRAPNDTIERWMKMDPLNVMNPGVGGTSTKFRYGKE